MTRCRAGMILVLFALGCGATKSSAQVATGTPPFTSFGGGPDVVNLADNNVQLTIPIVNKAGRGLPFGYALTYGSSIWYPGASGSSVVWTPVTAGSSYDYWGWQGLEPQGAPFIRYQPSELTGGRCFDRIGFYEPYTEWDYAYLRPNFQYVDPNGTQHSFNFSALEYIDFQYGIGGGRCPPAGANPPSASAIATDGSGLTLNVTPEDNGEVSAYVTTRDGTRVDAPIGTSGGTYWSETDRNGNVMSDNNGTFTDTLGVAELTVSGAEPGDTTLSYPGPSGSNASYTVKYTQNTVRTNFGCSGVGEFGPTTEYLVSEIDLPDGSKYTFSYEGTPGYSGDVTGRISEITLPTGGSITYTYSGGGDEITCADGSAAILTRTVSPDGGAWSYDHEEDINNPAHWSTTVTDPKGNDTTVDFEDGYEYERNVSGTDGADFRVDTCYNGATYPCAGATVTAPIYGQSTYTTRWLGSGSLVSETVIDYNTIGLVAQEDDYGYGSGPPPTTPLRKTLTTYDWGGSCGVTNPNVLDRPCTVKVEDGGGVVATEIDNTYDANGNLLQEASGGLSRSWTYNANGSVATATDVNGQRTTYGYGACGPSNNLLPTLITGPMGLTENLTWNCNGAVVTSIRDANGGTTSYSYSDPNYWRLGQVGYPGGGGQAFAYPSLTETDTYTGITNSAPSPGCASGCREDESVLDGLGRPYQSILASDPDGATTVTTTYDPANAQVAVTNPDRSGAGTNGTTTTTYDALGRPTDVAQPDGDVARTYYPHSGFDLTGDGGISAPLCPNPPELGYPALTVDAAGDKRETWTDALGRTIEVDEPNGSGGLTQATCSTYDANGNLVRVVAGGGSAASPGTASLALSGSEQSKSGGGGATPGAASVAFGGAEQSKPASGATAGSVSIGFSGTEQSKQVNGAYATASIAFSGSEQSKTTGATPGAVSIVFSGSEQSKTTGGTVSTGTIYVSGNCLTGCSESGAVYIGMISQPFSADNTDGLGVAQAIATAAQNTGLVTAYASTVTSGVWKVALTSRATGSGANYDMSSSYASGDFGVQWPSSMTGGTDGTTIYDSGTVTVTVNGHGDSTTYGQGSTASSICSGLASAISGDGSAYVAATCSGSTLAVTSKQTGSGANYPFSVTITYDSTDFSSPSFSASPSGGNLSGGADATTIYDHGTVTVTVNNSPVGSTSYGQGDTASSIVSRLASSIGNPCPNGTVQASASGSTLALQSCSQSSTADYPFSVAITYDSADFSSPSFSASPSSGNLTGGQAPQTIYDSGTVTVTVNGHPDSAPYQQGSTTSTIASGVATAINNDGSAYVTASASGSTLTVTAKQTGSGTNYPFSVSITYDSTDFTSPSFSASPSGGNLSGGSDGGGTIYDHGTVTVTVNSQQQASYSYGQSDTASTIAQQLSSAIGTGCSGLLVKAAVSGSALTLTACTAGSGTNYPFSVSITYDTNDFSSPSFSASPSSGNFSGGSDGGGTIYDSGTVTVTVNGHGDSTNYQQGSTTGTIVSGLASAIDNDGGASVTASASGSTLTVTSKSTGSSTNYPFTTSVSYDSNDFASASFSVSPSSGNLSGGTDAGGASQTRTYAYDTLGRALSVTTPESGTTTFSYNSNGDLASRTDARNVTTTYGYDALHRLTAVSYSDGTAAVSYFYDQTSYNGLTIANGKGRRTGMSDGSGETAWSYDAMGRIVAERKMISSVAETNSYAYNYDGSLSSLTYPDGRVVNYTYSNAQRPLSAIGSDGTNYAQNAVYAPDGSLASDLHGQGGTFAGVTETWGYNNDFEPTSVQATSSAGTALSLTYSFALPSGNNGSVAAMNNGNDSGRNETMTYDPLDRILTAQTQAMSGQDCWGLSFGVDTLANLLQMSPTKCSGPNLSVGVDASNHIVGYGYDAAGNATADGAYTYSYNAESEVTSAGGVNYTYDGDGLRVEKSSGTLYWRSYSGQVIEETNTSGVMQSDYIFFAGRRIAWKDGSGNVYYYFADALGSTRVVTTSSGATCFNADYYPYGQESDYTTACSPRYKFTGYEFDSETGNYYAYAREYDPRIGRFLSAHPLGGWLGNPQSLNRYSYVINNPESLSDPTGACGESFDDPCPPPPPPAGGGMCVAEEGVIGFVGAGPKGGPQSYSPTWGYEWVCSGGGAPPSATPGGGGGQQATPQAPCRTGFGFGVQGGADATLGVGYAGAVAMGSGAARAFSRAAATA